MYEDIEALRAVLNVPSSPVAAPPPVPTSLPPSKPSSTTSKPLPKAPSGYTSDFPAPPKTTTPAAGYPRPAVTSAISTTARTSPGVKTTTPGYPGPRAAPPTTTTARQPPAPKWPPSASTPSKAVDRPDEMNKRRTSKPQPSADGRFYCGVCREEIVGHQGIVTYQDNIWHTFCFKCFECKKPLRGVQFVRRENEVHCYECFKRKFTPRCSICNENIVGNDGMKLQDKVYHRKCFTCSVCNGELVGKKFTMQQKKPFCYDCYLKLYSKRCSKCNEYITGAYIDLGEVVYHEDCFKCSICKGMFTDGMMYKNSEGEFACSTCASAL